jgi:4-amino-4-deoxy-L-arabinose transferase-like glycosyltransferase
VRLRAVLLVVLVAALLVLPRLGHRPITGAHEAVFPVVARDILARHAWFGAELRGVPYRNKPPLYPWTIAVASWPAGRVTEITARLPGALAALGAAAVTCLLGARLFGPRAGLWAGLMLVTSILFFDHALVTIPDLEMLVCDLLAGLALWRVGNGGGRPALLGFYAALALAVFTKSLPGLLPLAVGLVWLAVDDGRRGVRRLVWMPGIVVFALISAVWAIPYAQSARFASDVAWHDWLQDPLGLLVPGTLVQQLASFGLGFLPWALLLPAALVAAMRARRVRAVSFALCWFLVQVVCILGVQQQRVRYLLPFLPGAALLVAWWADREASASHARPSLALTALGVALAAIFALPVALRRLDTTAVAPAGEIAAVVLGVLGVAVIAAFSLWTGRLAQGIPLVAATSALVLFAGGWIVEDWAHRAWDYAGVADRLRAAPSSLAVATLADDHELLQVDFYLGRSLAPLHSPEAVRDHLARAGAAVLVEGPRWRDAERWLPIDPRRLRIEALRADVVLVTDAPR